MCRVFLWVLSVIGFLGNSGSLLYRLCIKPTNNSLGIHVFVPSLSVSDLTMSIYQAIIGAADIFYRYKLFISSYEISENGVFLQLFTYKVSLGRYGSSNLLHN